MTFACATSCSHCLSATISMIEKNDDEKGERPICDIRRTICPPVANVGKKRSGGQSRSRAAEEEEGRERQSGGKRGRAGRGESAVPHKQSGGLAPARSRNRISVNDGYQTEKVRQELKTRENWNAQTAVSISCKNVGNEWENGAKK